MRTAVKALCDFSKKQFLEVLEAMVMYKSTLNKTEKAIFDVTFNALIKDGRTAELDGMQMRFIDKAIHHKAKKLMEEGKVQQYIYYRILASKVRNKLLSYQEMKCKKEME